MTLNFKRALTTTALSLLGASTLSSPALAGNTWDLLHGAPKFTDANGNTLKFRGRIFFDMASLDETDTEGYSSNPDEYEFRTARLGFEGQYDSVKFKAELDFAGSEITAKAINAKFQKLGGSKFDVTIGQMKTPASLNETTSSLHATYMERAAITDAFGLDRRLGVKIGTKGNHYTLEGGMFRNSINGLNENQDENTIFAVRGTVTPLLQKGALVHIGGFARYTDKANSGAPSRSSRWGSHLATEKVKPKVGNEARLYGVEAATVKGPFHAQAEYMSEDGDSGKADGYYLSAGYFLTGEIRAYKGGKFNRTKPNNPVSQGGYGGWEIAARFDAIDARQAGDEASSAATLGLIWYPESHLRFRLEAIEADADSYAASALQLRTQIDW